MPNQVNGQDDSVEFLKASLKATNAELSAAQAEIEKAKWNYIGACEDTRHANEQLATQALQIQELRDLLFNLRDGATGLWGGELDRCNEALSKTYDESALRKHVAGEINKAGYFANDDFVRAYADRYERNEV